MNKYCMIPVHLNALYLSASEVAAEASADFRRLPYSYYDDNSKAKRDVNSDTPWLGDSIASPPFENSNIMLQKGVHLHWALPDGLCHGEVKNGKIEMPSVPNRWLIQRRTVGCVTGETENKNIWIVESDYLWPSTNQSPAVNIFQLVKDRCQLVKTDDINNIPNPKIDVPYIVACVEGKFHFRILLGKDENGEDKFLDRNEDELGVKTQQIEKLRKELEGLWPPYQITESEEARICIAVKLICGFVERPYRFLGRNLSLSDWRQDVNRCHEYLEKLTAIGHGETTFAAYYPNCASVFGFLDRDLPDTWDTLQYDLIGWYGGDKSSPELSWEPYVDNQTNSLIERLRRWRVEGNDKPQMLVCYASIQLTKNETSDNSQKIDGDYKIAIGNTASEALCALLAKEVADDMENPNLASNVEEQLEALYIEGQLTSAAQDLGLRLRRYRHQNSFDSVSDYQFWTVHTEPTVAKNLPDKVVNALRDLNDVQAQYGQQLRELRQARRQLYGDWCNYMRCVYRPPDGGRGQFLDIDEVVSFIETRSLAEVETRKGIVSIIENKLIDAKNNLEYCLLSLNIEELNIKELCLNLNKILAYYLSVESLARSSEDAAAKLKEAETMIDELIHRLNNLNKETNRKNVLAATPQLNRDSVLNEARLARQTKKMEMESNNLEPLLSPTQFKLQSLPDARFWHPTDPVVLIAGGKVRLSDRNGRDGRNSVDGILNCEIYDTPIAKPDDEIRDKDNCNNILNILNWMKEYWNEYWKELEKDQNKLESCIGFRKVNVAKQPWNPLFLDWGIDVRSAESHAPNAQARYDSDIITSNYQLGSQYPDLQLGTLYVNDDPDRFSGRCILGDTPSLVMRDRIENTLRRRILEGKPELWANPKDKEYFGKITDWYDRKPINLPTTVGELKGLREWYKQRPLYDPTDKDATLGNRSDKAQDPLYCTILAYCKLFENCEVTNDNEKLTPRVFLGQGLSGFNGELIQWKLGLTLPIDEPIGMIPYREFTQRVAQAVGDEVAWATEPTNNFSPIRSGTLELDKLRIVDSFGQVADVACDENVIVPMPYRLPNRPGVAYLPPRLVQPARVNFRWLDAHSDEPREMVEAAARSPICGWLLHEKLRGSLLVFDGAGNPLGEIVADKNTNVLEWTIAPWLPKLTDSECIEGRNWLKRVSAKYYDIAVKDQGEEGLRDLGELGASIKNDRLARVILYIWATRSPVFLERFLNTLDDAMANIDPEGTTNMGTMALLVGRPVAVVGAELNLELQGKPAVRQDWEAFRLDRYRNRRNTNGFERVQFRLRIGEYKSRNDGVLGYWQDESGGFAANTFFAQAADDNDPSIKLEIAPNDISSQGLQAKINAHDSKDKTDDLNFTQSVADPPLQVTMLMDPRGQANLTTGILPVKTIDIPRTLWEPSLEAIRVWFQAAPILSRPNCRRVPTPTLVDRQWSWLEKEKVKMDNKSLVKPNTLFPRSSVKQVALQEEIKKLNEKINRKSPTDYQLILIKPSSTEAVPTAGKELIIARKVKSDDKYYLASIFDSAGNNVINKDTGEVVVNEKLTDLAILSDLDAFDKSKEKELVQKILSSLGHTELEIDRLTLIGPNSTEAVPTAGKKLIIARKVNSDDKYYLASIFDGTGNNVIKKDAELTDVTILSDLDAFDKSREKELVSREKELVQKILSSLGHTDLEIDRLALIRPNSTEAVPTAGKKLIIARKVNSDDKYYLASIFDGAGNEVVKDTELTDGAILRDLDAFDKSKEKELVQKILSSLGHTELEIDRLIAKGWLQEQEPPGDRLYLGAREDRKPLDDLALETPIDLLLASLSLALVSPGDEPDFNPGVEVREGWLILQASKK